MVRIQIQLYGTVQGVGFRYHTRNEASKLGLVGSVKNRADGAVEIVAEGEEHLISQLLDWARKGPTAAQVEHIEVAYDIPTDEFGTFSIER
ncbi:MAG: acylphosphatase [Cyanobacteria bacterium]|nr:acylphosphatase [Cyanobacteriota bacterium]